MKKLIFLIIAGFLPIMSQYAGDFRVSVKIDSVKKTGFYKIMLNPDLISYSQEDYSDIRLLNSKGQEIAYLLKEEAPSKAKKNFTRYNFIENQYIEKYKLTRVVVHNASKNLISTLNLVVRNTAIEKEIVLKGSDNQKDWFIIYKGIPLKNGNFSESSSIYLLNFPSVDYEYMELTTNDKQKDPVQFLAIGNYNTKVSAGLYTQLPVKKMMIKDSSDKKTYIRLIFKQSYEIDKVAVNVLKPELYQRNVMLGYFSKESDKTVFQNIDNFELSSAKTAEHETPKFRTGELVLVIDNLDSAPLTIDSVQVFQLRKYIVAQLEAGDTYFIKAGKPDVKVPEYDLKYFADHIPDSLMFIQTSNLKVAGNLPTSGSQVVFTKTILWGVIILVISLLAFLSFRMVKEMNKKEN